MYRFLPLFFTCVIISAASRRHHHRHDYDCDYPSIYDYPSSEEYHDYKHPPSSEEYPDINHRHPPSTSTKTPSTPNDRPKITTQHHLSTTITPSTTTTTTIASPPILDKPRPTPPPLYSVLDAAVPPPLESVISRIGDDINTIQEKQMNELNCLQVLDGLITAQWQEEIDKLSVKDLGDFSTAYVVPSFSDLYSNPESEWIQDGEMAHTKLDKCVRNLVSKIAPRMGPEETQCLNKIYENYFPRELDSAIQMQMFIDATSREQLPFKSVYTYYEITEVLFQNKNIESLDDEVRSIYEDMEMFYIKNEEDKAKKIFIIEQECEWKNARLLREAGSENERYKKFGQLVKSLVNRYLAGEILHRWIPGVIIPQSRYDLWSNARKTMDQSIQDKVNELQSQKKDAQFLCTYAAELATKLYSDQKAILFEGMKNTSLSFELNVRQKLAYVLALERLLTEKNDNRISHVKVLVNEFKENDYCLTNLVRMVENHQRYDVASSFTNELLPYGNTYCLIKEMSAKLVSPRYCKCQGTFCEKFGLATVRAERYKLNLLPNGTYEVIANASYRIIPFDPLIDFANNRIKDLKLDTWYYRHQHHHKKV